jgi:hypothetical protein
MKKIALSSSFESKNNFLGVNKASSEIEIKISER